MAWLTGAVAPVGVVPVDQIPAGAEAVLPPAHMVPSLAWKAWPVAPLTAVLAHLFRVPIAALAGPCVNLQLRELEAVRSMLGEAGWMGEPVIAVQTDTHPTGGPLTQRWRAQKVPRSLDQAIPYLVARGRFVLRVGAAPADDAVGLGHGVVDLGGCSLARMTAALYAADLALTGDSGPLHLAAAVGTPVAALFGPSDPALHVCAAGTVPITPPVTACEHLPCGRGSLLGGPLEADQATRVPLPCPPAGGCLSRMSGAQVAAAAERVLAQVAQA